MISWLRIHRDLPVYASLVLGLKACATVPVFLPALLIFSVTYHLNGVNEQYTGFLVVARTLKLQTYNKNMATC